MSAIYLTPKRFRTLGSGIDLTGMSDADILPSLTVASAMVNTYCAVPTDHDFRGGSITAEQHRWDMGNQWKRGNNKVFPFHRPLKSVTKLQIDVSNEQRVTLAETSLYVNKVEGWVEPVQMALTTVGLFGWSILPNIGLREPVAKVDYTYGWLFSVINETLTSYSGGDLQAANQFWDEDTAPVVRKNGATLPTDQYTVDYNEGMVAVSSYDSTAIYAADYSHTLPIAISRATGMVTADVLSQATLATSGLVGLSGLRVEEVDMRQSTKIGLYNVPVNGAAQTLLAPYKYLNWG